MTGLEILFVASLAASAAGTIYTGQQQRKVARSQERVARLERQKARIAEAKARREAIRTARTANAAVINAGANRGVQDSSGVQGGAASVISQGNANLSFLDQSTHIADQTSTELGRIRKYQQKAQTGQMVTSLANKVAGSTFGASGQQALYTRIFGGG